MNSYGLSISQNAAQAENKSRLEANTGKTKPRDGVRVNQRFGADTRKEKNLSSLV